MMNIKPRLVTCRTCKDDIVTDAPAPKCPRCGGNFVVVLYSIIDGTRITT